jgi:hypothetical protein
MDGGTAPQDVHAESRTCRSMTVENWTNHTRTERERMTTPTPRPPVVGTTSISRQLSPHAEPPGTGAGPGEREVPAVRSLRRSHRHRPRWNVRHVNGGRGRRTGCRERAFAGTPSGAGITALIQRGRDRRSARSRTRRIGHGRRAAGSSSNGTCLRAPFLRRERYRMRGIGHELMSGASG